MRASPVVSHAICCLTHASGTAGQAGSGTGRLSGPLSLRERARVNTVQLAVIGFMPMPCDCGFILRERQCPPRAFTPFAGAAGVRPGVHAGSAVPGVYLLSTYRLLACQPRLRGSRQWEEPGEPG